MLRSFRVANHRSIRAEQELVLLRAYDKTQDVVPVVGIFGANASGKSNLLDALAFMQSAVRTSFAGWEAGSGVPRNRFRLDPETAKEPSLFAVDLVIEGIQYAYGFTIDSERVVEEWLYSYPHRRKRVIFERDDSNGVTFGSTVSEHRSRTDLLTGLTRENSLLLSAAAQANQDVVAPVYEWFRTSLRFVRRASGVISLIDPLRVASAIEADPRIIELVKAADLGLGDLRVVRDGPGAAREDRRLADRWGALAARTDRAAELATVVDRLQASLEHLGSDHTSRPALEEELVAALRGQKLARDQLLEARSNFMRLQGARERPQLVFLHGDQLAPLTMADESDGTLAWLSLLLEAMEVLRDGSILAVDEIDSSLHPHLTARLIGLFQDSQTNPQSAQLIFTTHDATLLSPALGEDTLKRDQVWFIEKDTQGASKLYPLSDFHPRNGENTARRYLGGSYGAVPETSEYAFRSALLDGVSADDKA